MSNCQLRNDPKRTLKWIWIAAASPTYSAASNSNDRLHEIFTSTRKLGACRSVALLIAGGNADVIEKLNTALSHMTAALRILDTSDASSDVGAHLDLAICRLNEIIEHNRGAESGRQAWARKQRSAN
jgi:hypothetical protein